MKEFVSALFAVLPLPSRYAVTFHSERGVQGGLCDRVYICDVGFDGVYVEGHVGVRAALGVGVTTNMLTL